MISIVQLADIDKAWHTDYPKEGREWTDAKMNAVKNRQVVSSDIPGDNIVFINPCYLA
jgi:hypothetical protein